MFEPGRNNQLHPIIYAMKAAVLYRPGSPEVFVLEERPIPVPNNQQVLVNVKAFGLNRSELMTRKGYSPNQGAGKLVVLP